MANLASMIMEGSMYGFSRANLTHTYDHEDGACLIAMESAEALRDIFEAEFYIPNSCTIQAAMEGASCVEESSQATIMEASIKGAFTKIKEFFIKLKEKVKEFFHNLKRYLLGIFGNDAKWVSSYEKELTALKSADLKGYKIKIYDYTLGKISAVEQEAKNLELLNHAKQAVQDLVMGRRQDASEIDEDDLKQESNKIIAKYMASIGDISDVEADDIDKQIWSAFRGGADTENDKQEVEVYSNIKTYIAAIKSGSSDVSKIESVASKLDEKYKKAIKFIDDTAKHYEDVKTTDLGDGTIGVKSHNKSDDTAYIMTNAGLSNITKILRGFSSDMSTTQNFTNKVMTAYKTALVERNKEYKKALTGAFGYAKKTRKKNKK